MFFILLCNLNSNVMEKIIVDSETKKAYVFDGKRLKQLGVTRTMRRIWQDKIFAFGNDFYLRNGEEFSLLAEEAELRWILTTNKFASKQFELLGDVLVMNDSNIAGIQKLDKAYAQFLNEDLFAKEKPILFFQQKKSKKALVVIEKGFGNICLSEKEAIFLDDMCCFLAWNSRIYSYFRKNDCFVLQSLHLLFEGNDYLVFSCKDECLGECAYILKKNGEMIAVGTAPRLHRFPNAILLEFSNGVYHLKNDNFISVISFCYPENSYSVLDNGDIIYRFTIKYNDAPDTFSEETYRLVDGEYRLVR